MLRFSIMFVSLKAYDYIFTALVLLLYCGLSITTVNAQQAPQEADAPGLITGIVTDSAGMPLADIAVSLYREPEGQLRSVMTDAKGAYRFGLLAAGIYQLAFRDPNEQYALQFYGGAPVQATATEIVVAGQVVTVAPVSLTLGSRITGTITNRTGMPLGQLSIRGFIKAQNEWHLVAEKWLAEEAQTYSLGGLPAGVFHLCATNPTVAECYPDVVADHGPIPENVENAQDIALAIGEQRPHIDFVLGDSSSRGEISGYVTDAAGAPIVAIAVSAYSMSAWSTFALAKTVQTDSAGYYRLPYLLPSQYVLVFRDMEKHLYAEQFYQHPITIRAGSRVESNNVVMATGGQMVGRVRVAGEVVSDARLWLYRQSADGWQVEGFSWVDASGVYTATGLATGLYRVQGEVRLNGNAYYHGYHGGLTPESATTVPVTAGATLTQDLDLVVAPDLFAGVISGTVRNAGQPLAGIQVEVIAATNSRVVVYTTSDQQGRYQIAGLPDDQYYLRFSDPTATYAFSWYSLLWPSNNEPPIRKEDATPVRIKGATIARNVDGTLLRAGAIQGRVRRANDAPAVAITVQLLARDNQQGWVWLLCDALNRCPYTTLTDTEGRYHFQGLAPGRYRVGFFPSFYGPGLRYYPFAGSVESARDVIVQADAVTSGIDGTVGPLPQIFLPFVAR